MNDVMNLDKIAALITAIATFMSAAIAIVVFVDRKLSEKRKLYVILRPYKEWLLKTRKFYQLIFNEKRSESVNELYKKYKKFKPVYNRHISDLYSLEELNRIKKYQKNVLHNLIEYLIQYIRLFDFFVSELQNAENINFGMLEEKLQNECPCDNTESPNQKIDEYIFHRIDILESLFKELNI